MLPFYEHARREAGAEENMPPILAGCESCLKRTQLFERQSWACHREVAAPSSIPVRPWDHSWRKQVNAETPMCAGYVCRLPMVIEGARAHMHWTRMQGSPAYKDGNDRLTDCVEIFEGAVSAFKAAERENNK